MKRNGSVVIFVVFDIDVKKLEMLIKNLIVLNEKHNELVPQVNFLRLIKYQVKICPLQS